MADESKETTSGRSAARSPNESLAQGLDRIRETTKWLITTFAALGAILIAGTQLSAIGELDLARGDFWVALVGGLGALIGIWLAIWHASNVLIGGVIGLSDLDATDMSPSFS